MARIGLSRGSCRFGDSQLLTRLTENSRQRMGRTPFWTRTDRRFRARLATLISRKAVTEARRTNPIAQFREAIIVAIVP